MAPYRLILMALPPDPVRVAAEAAVSQQGLDAVMGDARFPARNWHQSLSNRHPYSSELHGAMLRAGARVLAAPVTMLFNRIGGHSGSAQDIHWALRARGNPKGFTELCAAVRDALRSEGIPEESGHQPHVTICYRAPRSLPSVFIKPIQWTIDEIALVCGGGAPYRYEVLGRWPLVRDPAEPVVSQMRLF